MSNGLACALSTTAAVLALTLPASAQSVISTHSGVIHYFEGAVYLGDQPLEARLGKYTTMPQGAELRTADGRAEVLLTPGVFIRLGERSAIQLTGNDLADTQVELRSGSAIVDAGEQNADTSVTLRYKDWKIHFVQKGVYRIDSDPPRLWVRQGKAEVFTAPGGQMPDHARPVPVEQGMMLPFARVLVADRSTDEPHDTLRDWSKGRGESITADNTITAQIDEDPSTRPPGTEVDNFSYFPMLGVLSPNPDTPALYGSYYPDQPGFHSVYLPGYTYQPIMMMGLAGHSYRSVLRGTSLGVTRGIGGVPSAYGGISSPRTIGIPPGYGVITPFPRGPGGITPVAPRPFPGAYGPRPAAPVPVHPGPTPHVGGPPVGHR